MQLLLSPDVSVTLYVMYFLPTFTFCGGIVHGMLRLRGSLELSVGSGTFHVTFAYDWPISVEILSILFGHVILGAWTSVEETAFF